MPQLTTPDGRYLIVRGRLWRTSDPALPDAQRQHLVDALMAARRAVKHAKQSNDAKHALGERGPVWWTDGAPDYNRHLVKNSPYAAWYVDREAPRS